MSQTREQVINRANRSAQSRALRRGVGLHARRATQTSPWWALLFVAPMALGLAIFYLWPLVRTFALALTRSSPFTEATFVGGENFTRLFTDPAAVGALHNTLLFALVSLIGIPVSLVIAAMLATKDLRGRSIYRTLYFLPVVTMPAAVAMIWQFIYHGDYGILNRTVRAVGLPEVAWLTNPDTVLFALAVVGIWGGLGINVVILLAGLQSIPSTVHEAAELDGAGPVRTFFSITVPLLSPSVFFVTVITVIGSLQMFDLVYMMVTPTNPALPAARTVVYYFYQIGFVGNERGYAAAIACGVFMLILGLTVIQFRLQHRWVHHD